MQQACDPLEIAMMGIVRIAIGTLKFTGLMASKMTTTGTAYLDLAGLRHSNALEQSLVGLVLWHSCSSSKNLNHPDIGLSRA